MIEKNKIVDGYLVLEIQAGSKKAFAILVKRWHKRLCQQAYWYTKDKEVSKDIAQDSWTIILNKIMGLKDPNSFGSWALKIVTRKSIDWYRKHRKERSLKSSLSVSKSIEPEDVGKDTNRLLAVMHVAICKLPMRQQEIIRLYYIEELSVRQISNVLEVPKGTVKSRLYTAREKLKNELKKQKT